HLAAVEIERHVADHRAVAIGLAQSGDPQTLPGARSGLRRPDRRRGRRGGVKRRARAVHQFPPGCRTLRTRPDTLAVPVDRFTSIFSPDSTLCPWVSMTSPVRVTLPLATS